MIEDVELLEKVNVLKEEHIQQSLKSTVDSEVLQIEVTAETTNASIKQNATQIDQMQSKFKSIKAINEKFRIFVQSFQENEKKFASKLRDVRVQTHSAVIQDLEKDIFDDRASVNSEGSSPFGRAKLAGLRSKRSSSAKGSQIFDQIEIN